MTTPTPSPPPRPEVGPKRARPEEPPPRARKKSLDEQIERAESEGMVTERAKVSSVDPDHAKAHPHETPTPTEKDPPKR